MTNPGSKAGLMQCKWPEVAAWEDWGRVQAWQKQEGKELSGRGVHQDAVG